jgi:hypothetical protein
MRYGQSLIVLCGVGALLTHATLASAAGPAALVLEVTGGKVSGAQPYSEIAEGTTVTIPAGVRLVFQHYTSCRKVAVAGGSVAFTSEGYTITGGTKESDVRVSCPRKVTLKASGEAAGVVLRSVGAMTLSTRPVVVLIGPRADEFKTARVVQGETVVLEGALEGRLFRWPASAAPLSAATTYTLHLIPSAAGAAPLSTRFVTPRPSVVPPDETPTLIAVE